MLSLILKPCFCRYFHTLLLVCYLLVKFIPVWFFMVYCRWKGLHTQKKKTHNRNENPIFHFSLSSYYNSQVNFTLATSRWTIFEYNQLKNILIQTFYLNIGKSMKSNTSPFFNAFEYE